MGQALGEILAAGCLSDCSKYVLNSCHSSCKLSECCECDIQTDKVEIQDDVSETEIETICFKVHHK